jgi:DNA-binding NtrC family response regulator
MNYKILIADDKPIVLRSFEDALANHLDITADFSKTTADVINKVEADPYGYAVILLDYHFEGEVLTGADLAKQLLDINPKLLILIMTGDDSADAPIASLRAGVKDFIQKGNDLSTTIEVIRNYCKMFDETRRVITQQSSNRTRFLKNEKLIGQIGMVGWSDDMANVANQVLQLSQSNSDSTVLINGESGTGKELVAKAIHNLSNRESKKFIAINCGAIPANLLESELFGHERGSFTGATTKKIGKFQIANGGTIFLDEIGDMPLELQVKLLRVLQEGTIEPVGSTSPIKVNVRVLAATHVNLEEAISDGRFREDLFYRLNVIPIYLSPLRKRPDDIEPLLLHFQEKHKGGDKKILYKTLRYLKNYSWKGNVRELENTIDRLLTMVTDSEITPEHLDAKFFTTTQGAFEEFDCDYPTFKKMLDEMAEEKEKEYILFKLRGEKSLRSAAERISIPNTSLQRRLNSWGYSVSEVL